MKIYLPLRLCAVCVMLTLTAQTATSAVSGRTMLKKADSVKVSMALENSPVEYVLASLETKTGMKVHYDQASLSPGRNVSINMKDAPVQLVLNEISEQTGLRFAVINDKVIIEGKQDRAISVNGTVRDQKGAPLPGVSVMIKRTQKGTQTNAEGRFTLSVQAGDVLVFSFLGFDRKEVTVGGQTTINVVLEENARALNEVIVTALGIKRQAKAVGYSTTQVSGSEFTQSRDVNLGNALTGKVAGVSVANNATGAAGSSRVIIRGNASLTGNNQPLYVIDGVPFDNTALGSAGQWGGVDLGDGLSNINPDDIQDIQILKGTAASALYGYRGGNGAVLITTKSGSQSKGLGIEFNNNFTFNSVIDFREFQTEYGQGTQGNKPSTPTAALSTPSSSWGAKLDGSDAVNLLGNTYRYSMGADNWESFYQTGLNNQTSLAVSGGSDKVRYRVGLSNLYNRSNIPNSNLRQEGVNVNSTYDITSKLQLTLTANYVFERVKNRALLSDGSTNVNATLMYLSNSFDVRWLEPAVKDSGVELTPGSDQYFNNPYFLAYHHQNNTDRNRLTGGLTLKYNIFDWLYVQGQVTRDGYIFDYRKVTPTGTAYANGGELTEYERNYRELNGNFLIGANKKLNDVFSVSATFGGNSQDNINKAYGLGLSDRAGESGPAASPFIIPYLYTATNIANRPYVQQYAHYRVNSLYGTADFGFKDYLFLNLTGRQDWFSTLNPRNNHYFYPSVSASFVFSDAFKMPSWIYSGKIRASYAEASNGTTPYQNYLTYGMRDYTITGNSVGMVSNTDVPNSDLKPVQISEREVGMNVQFLNNRLGLDVAVYNKRTEDDIATITSSLASGYNAAIFNVGKIRNTGFEGMLSGVPVRTDKFTWNTSFNIAINDSKVLYLGEGVESLSIKGAVPRNGAGVSVNNVVGMSYGQIYGYAYRRDDAGNIIFAGNGEPLRTTAVVPLGSGVYRTTGGFSNDFRYKNFSLSGLFDFKFGAKLYSGTNLSLYSTGLQKTTLQGREGGYVGQGVKEDGSVNTTAVDAETYWRNLANSNNIAEEFIYDASFIKLRQLAFGYTVPASLLKNYFIKGLNFSIVARNLATIVKHTPNIDPEAAYNNGNGQGLESNGYPPVRSIGFNLNVKF